MMRSMTGYSRIQKKTDLGSWSVELHSVNRKGLDISISLPRELFSLEIELRKQISKFLHRGQITLRIHLQIEEKSLIEHELTTLKHLKSTFDKISTSLGYDPKEEVSLNFLMQQKQLLEPVYHLQEHDKKEVEEILNSAIKDLLKMRDQEGKELEKDVTHRLKEIEKGIKELEPLGQLPIERYKLKLSEKLREFYVSSEEEQVRVFREVAVLAEKLDTTEETTRLKSHIKQFFHYMASTEPSIGRTLDFLTQEMQREMNTISAKAADTEIIHKMVSLKGELEKIREQIQNIE